jgi:hypothetical protein
MAKPGKSKEFIPVRFLGTYVNQHIEGYYQLKAIASSSSSGLFGLGVLSQKTPYQLVVEKYNEIKD